VQSEPEPTEDDEEADATEKKTQNNDKDEAKDASSSSSAKQLHSTSRHQTEPDSSPRKPAYPVCWFEDEDTRTALRWHLFVGVLFDMKRKQHGHHQRLSSPSLLPWKLRLHFTNYPSSQILPLEESLVLKAVQSVFRHSIKQGLTLQTGNAKAALNLTKESHELLWDAIRSANYQLYQQVRNSNKATTSVSSRIPIRVLVDSNPPIQRPFSCDEHLTLGELFLRWLPDHFFVSTSKDTDDAKEAGDGVTNDNKPHQSISPNDTVQWWKVSGVQPPLDASVLDLWKCVSHPDHFLYLIVLTKTG
jgi:autophagy-related protein 5